MFWLIVGLVVLGGLLVTAELFVPGMVLGFLGGVALVASVVLCFTEYGFAPGLALAGALGLAAMIGFLLWMKAFPRTFVGKRLTNAAAVKGPTDVPDFSAFVGKSGHALSPLRPSGTAEIEGRRVDVVTNGEFLAAGTPLTVVRAEGARVVVRQGAGS